MLTFAQGLSPIELDAIADLERRVVSVDGGRLKLEWGTLRTRSGQLVEDVLAWRGGRLVGFAGAYAFGTATIELTGMVDPQVRRRGLASALLDASLGTCADRGFAQALLVAPRAGAGAQQLALSRGGVLSHSEHALILTTPPACGPENDELVIRPAVPDDSLDVARLLAAGFGGDADDLMPQVRRRIDTTMIAECGGARVGALRVEHEGDVGAVYGFVVDPARQGQGLGRRILGRVSAELFAAGAGSVALEVATHNERALGLYTSLGFTPVAVEDYYALAVQGRMWPSPVTT